MLDERLNDILLEREAVRRGTSVDELISQEVTRKARPVSRDEARTVLEATAASVPSASVRGEPESVLLERVMRNIEKQRQAVRKAAFLSEMRDRYSVRVLLSPPRVDLNMTSGPTLGRDAAPVALVIFTDFQCPYCATLTRSVKEVATKYGSQLRVVLKHFPLGMHKDAERAAEAAACAAEQDRFWPFHDWLFANQNQIPSTNMSTLATDLGLDARRFGSCIKEGRGAAVMKRDREEGEAHGVANTPTFFINGRYFVGAPPPDALSKLIDEELERK